MNYVYSVVGQDNLIPGNPKDSVVKTNHREVDFGMYVSIAQDTCILSKPSNSDLHLWIHRLLDFHFRRDVFYLQRNL